MTRISAMLPNSLKENKHLAIMIALGLAYFFLGALCLGFDHRELMGEYVWIKPCKFGLSIASYAASLLWLSKYVGSYKSLFDTCCKRALVGAVVELTSLAIQAGNMLPGLQGNGPWHEALTFSLSLAIKLGIMPVALLMPVTLFFLFKQKDLPPVLGSSLCWATFIATLGMIPGIIMVLPGSHQFALSHHGGFGHGMSVALGVRTPISPWLGWSTTGGDLRAAHFFGLHGLQILPLAAIATRKYLSTWTTEAQKLLIANLGLTYCAYLVLMTVQALLGESLFHPAQATVRLSLTIAGFSIATAVLSARLGRQNLGLTAEASEA